MSAAAAVERDVWKNVTENFFDGNSWLLIYLIHVGRIFFAFLLFSQRIWMPLNAFKSIFQRHSVCIVVCWAFNEFANTFFYFSDKSAWHYAFVCRHHMFGSFFSWLSFVDWQYCSTVRQTKCLIKISSFQYTYLMTPSFRLSKELNCA